ncbi:hypothetical protein [Hyphococcus sp.]|uniref:hypothetical protein n=1 Tax=Hyphococcus sp. TaxID=2038636 RepID=UPI003CCC33E5
MKARSFLTVIILTAFAGACSGGGDSEAEYADRDGDAAAYQTGAEQNEPYAQSQQGMAQQGMSQQGMGQSAPAQRSMASQQMSSSGTGTGTIAAAKDLPPGAYRLKRVEIIDRQGFEKPMTAMTMMVPVDWTGQGGVVWGANSGCGAGSGYTTDYTVSSPDGRSRAHLFPSYNWVWNSFSGGAGQGNCPFLQIRTVEQYLNYLVSQTRQGARILDYRPRADIAEGYKFMNSRSPMAGGEMRSWVEAGEVLIGYNQNGAELRESLAAVVYFNQTLTQPSMGMAGSEIIAGSAMPGFAMRAPDGALDFNFAELVRKSIKPSPEWSQRIARHNSKIAQTNLQGARDRSKIIAQTGEEIRQIQSDTWRTQSESFDRTSRETSEAIRGVETFNDPYYGGTVELDHSYDNAWQLNDGTYVLTDDTMFEPYRDLGVDGQRLEPSQ